MVATSDAVKGVLNGSSKSEPCAVPSVSKVVRASLQGGGMDSLPSLLKLKLLPASEPFFQEPCLLSLDEERYNATGGA